jgi:hypothetical protein
VQDEVLRVPQEPDAEPGLHVLALDAERARDGEPGLYAPALDEASCVPPALRAAQGQGAGPHARPALRVPRGLRAKRERDAEWRVPRGPHAQRGPHVPLSECVEREQDARLVQRALQEQHARSELYDAQAQHVPQAQCECVPQAQHVQWEWCGEPVRHVQW